MSFGQTGAQTYDALNALVVAYRSYGYTRIVVLTCISLGVGGETERQAYNTLVRANDGPSTFTIADIGANSFIGDVGDELNETYYSTDHLHLVAGGWNVVSPIVTAAIQSLP